MVIIETQQSLAFQIQTHESAGKEIYHLLL